MTDVPTPDADEPRTLTEVRAHVVALSNSLNKYRADINDLEKLSQRAHDILAAQFSEYAKHTDRALAELDGRIQRLERWMGEEQ